MPVIQRRKEVKNLKTSLITIFIIFLAITTSVNFVSAQNESGELISTINNSEEEFIENEVKKRKIGTEVKSQENGNYNITLDNGYNGYCVDYGDHETGVNDTFIIKDTSNIVN